MLIDDAYCINTNCFTIRTEKNIGYSYSISLDGYASNARQNSAQVPDRAIEDDQKAAGCL